MILALVCKNRPATYMKSEECAAICDSEMPCVPRSSMMRVKKSGRSESFCKRLNMISMVRPINKIEMINFLTFSQDFSYVPHVCEYLEELCQSRQEIAS